MNKVISEAVTNEPARQEYFMDKCHEIIEEMILKKGRAPFYHVATFGCQMNAHDSEKLRGILERIGYIETADESDADFIIYNTCTVRENANQKLYGHLGSLKKKKTSSPDMIIGLCGCMTQQPDTLEYIKEKYSFVDIVCGTFNFYKMAEFLYMKLSGEAKQIIEILPEPQKNVERLPEKRKYSFKSGVNIMYGCNNFCTYCIVPFRRGKMRSRNKENVIKEAKYLVEQGYQEIVLSGIHVGGYGQDLKDCSFSDLVEELSDIPNLKSLRISSIEESEIDDKLIKLIQTRDNLAKHLHIPLQAGSNHVLKMMNRKYTQVMSS